MESQNLRQALELLQAGFDEHERSYDAQYVHRAHGLLFGLIHHLDKHQPGILEVFDAIIEERRHQDDKYGSVNARKTALNEFFKIIQLEIQEAFIGFCKNTEGRHSARSELVQVAAVAIAALQQHGLEPANREPIHQCPRCGFLLTWEDCLEGDGQSLGCGSCGHVEDFIEPSQEEPKAEPVPQSHPRSLAQCVQMLDEAFDAEELSYDTQGVNHAHRHLTYLLKRQNQSDETAQQDQELLDWVDEIGDIRIINDILDGEMSVSVWRYVGNINDRKAEVLTEGAPSVRIALQQARANFNRSKQESGVQS